MPLSCFQLVLALSFLSENHFVAFVQGRRTTLTESRSLLGQVFFACLFLFFFFSSCVRILAHFSVLEICKFSFLLFSFPNNSLLQIMLLTDPEIESSLLISSDEGATYQKYRLNFYLQSLLFHPKQEDWILAYSQDQKVSPITL